MTKAARITADDGFKCAPDGHTTIKVPKGDLVYGKIAEAAIKAKKAKAHEVKAEAAAPENKGDGGEGDK